MLSERVELWSKQLREEGRAEGKAEGEAKGKAAIAKKLLASGMPVSKVAELTDLTEVEVKRLAENP